MNGTPRFAGSTLRCGGSTLILVLILTILLAGLGVAVLSTSFSFHRASREMLARDQAFWASESAGGYYLSLVSGDEHYFETHPAPHGEVLLGDASFHLESAELVAGSSHQWHLLINGFYGGVDFPLNVVVGPRQVAVPAGVIATGRGSGDDGDDDDDGWNAVIRLTSGTRIGSYNSDDAPYDPADPGSDAVVLGRGNMSLRSATILGDATLTGMATEDAVVSITGDLVEEAPDFPVSNIDPIASAALEGSRGSNDNSALSGVFTDQWSPALGLEGYGDLIVVRSGTYVVPPGTYRFRRFEVRNGANVIFDTSGGPSKLVYVGSGSWSGGSDDDLTVTGGSSVKVSAGSTRNVLQVVLGSHTDVVVSSGSVFGQSTEDPDDAGYTQILSASRDSGGDEVIVKEGSTAFARLYAMGHSTTVDTSSWFGSVLARTLRFRNASFAVDLGSTGRMLADPTQYDVLCRWPAPGS